MKVCRLLNIFRISVSGREFKLSPFALSFNSFRTVPNIFIQYNLLNKIIVHVLRNNFRMSVLLETSFARFVPIQYIFCVQLLHSLLNTQFIIVLSSKFWFVLLQVLVILFQDDGELPQVGDDGWGRCDGVSSAVRQPLLTHHVTFAVQLSLAVVQLTPSPVQSAALLHGSGG